MSPDYLADIHVHPTLKPYPSGESIWKYLPERTEYCEKLPGPIRGGLSELSKSSQFNLDKALIGNLRLVFASLYPVERDFFRVQRKHIALRLFLKNRHLRPMAACVSGLPMDKVTSIFKRIEENRGIDYFREELVKEYQYLVNQANISQSSNKDFTIIGDYEEYDRIPKNDPNELDTIAVALTIEGAHALGDYSNDHYFTTPYEQLSESEQIALKDSFDNNIDAMKGWNNGKHVPLFVTFCHHFWNQLAGHAKSFSNRPALSLKPGMDRLFDQSLGLNHGITELGWFVIEKLLDDSERSVLIDVKHMSVKSRRQYYEYLESREERIPLICSHAACNGWARFEDVENKGDNFGLDRDAYFSRWSINLTDDDIRAFKRQKGLIGLVLHEGRMPGRKAKKLFNKLKGKEMWSALRKEYVRLLLSNMFHIARLIGDESAWEMICLGSDFDGLIDPFNTYDDGEKLDLLISEIRQYLMFENESYDLTIYENNQVTWVLLRFMLTYCLRLIFVLIM
jgi:microsomal dipeptidase-like Zn-dependent dipeptidase